MSSLKMNLLTSFVRRCLTYLIFMSTGFAPATWGAEPPTSLSENIDVYDTTKRFSTPAGKPEGVYKEYQSFADRSYYGFFSKERHETVIDPIIRKLLNGLAGESHPEIIFTAGNMASGKTTAVRRLMEDRVLDPSRYLWIDADLIKGKIPEFKLYAGNKISNAGGYVHLESMYIGDVLFEYALRNGLNIVYDTSFYHEPSMKVWIERIRKQFPRYKMTLLNVRTPHDEVQKRAIERANREVNGRIIPPQLISDRHLVIGKTVRSLAGLFDLYVSLSGLNSGVTHWRVKGADTRFEHQFYPPMSSLQMRQFCPEGTLQTCQINGKNSYEEPIDILIDMDKTFVYQISREQYETLKLDPKKHRLFSHNGEYYRFSDGAVEFFSVLLDYVPSLPFRFSVFSAADFERNEKAMMSLKLTQSISVYDIVFQMLDETDMTPVPEADTNARYSLRYQKNVLRVWPDLNLERVALMDDISWFTPEAQRRNIIWMNQTHAFFDAYLPNAPVDPEGTPNTAVEFWFERNKLAVALGLILEAYDISKATGETFTKTYSRLQRDEKGSFLSMTDAKRKAWAERGIAEMKKKNEGFYALPYPRFECVDTLATVRPNPESSK